MHIVATHKGTGFGALASVMAANLLHPDVVMILPGLYIPMFTRFWRCTVTFSVSVRRVLSDIYTNSDERKAIFFLLKVKCKVIANHIGVDEGAIVLKTNGD